MYYDSNNIQLSTQVDEVDSEDVAAKYKAWGWNVLSVDGHNIDALRKAIAAANAETGLSGLQTGYTGLDKMTSGWQNSDLIIIAAPPRHG